MDVIGAVCLFNLWSTQLLKEKVIEWSALHTANLVAAICEGGTSRIGDASTSEQPSVEVSVRCRQQFVL